MDGTFVLEVADFEVETFDLSVELRWMLDGMIGVLGGRKRMLTRIAAFSLKQTFSSWMTWAFSKLAMMSLQ